MTFLAKIGPALPPWSTRAKLTTTALTALTVALWVARDSPATKVWSSIVERRDSIAGTLLSVHASLLGFAVATVAIIISVRGDPSFAQLEKFQHASYQMWDALNSASWATGVASLTSLFAMIFAKDTFAGWFENMIAASLFVTTFYVTLALVGVLAVVHALVIILRPPKAPRVVPPGRAEPATTAFQELGPPSDH